MAQSRRFTFVCVNDSYTEQVPLAGRHQVLEPVDVGRVIESVLMPIAKGGEGVAYGHRVTGEISGKWGKFELHGAAHIASIAVCLKSVAGPALAGWIANGNEFERPQSPWVAVNYICPPEFKKHEYALIQTETFDKVAPEWVEYWVKCLGAGLIRREGW